MIFVGIDVHEKKKDVVNIKQQKNRTISETRTWFVMSSCDVTTPPYMDQSGFILILYC